jgi:hypothetical protein
MLVEWMLRDRLPARLNLQLHKYIWDPEAGGSESFYKVQLLRNLTTYLAVRKALISLFR